MNYYPNNYYPNYPYGNMYTQQAQPMIQPQTQPAVQSPQLQGKIVDGEDMVRATEVPFGGYGIFPTADLSKVYIKTWNNNGTTQITSYQPVISEKVEAEEKVDTTSLILEKMKEIEVKIDNIVNQNNAVPTEKIVRKETKTNAF